jgi:thiol-disulfide isomerase/thioredoxin
MFKKIFFSFLLSAGMVFGAGRAMAADEVTVYFFWGDGCSHCAKEEVFLKDLQSRYPQVAVRDFEVWKNSDNQKLLADMGKRLEVQISGVPFTIVGEKYFSGWFDDKTSGRAIEEAVNYALKSNCRDIAGEVLLPDQAAAMTAENCAAIEEKKDVPQTIDVPVFGRIEAKNFSLPVLTVVLGGLDGFNPCAMWTLLFLIGLLLGTEDRRRMWILGVAFIVASAAVYFAFMAAWLNLVLFIGLIFWVRLAVGGVALFGGGYNLKEYFGKKPSVCKSGTDPKQQKIFEKLKAITQRRNFYLALGGIILLAFAVNLVELICSAGFPVIFTQILTMSGLSWWQYYLYILLYVFFFMFDDMIVFFTAMMTLKMAGITTKYQRLSHLIGGVLMLAIGLLLIFRPEWLMFG